MKNVRTRLFTVGALLASLLAPPTQAEPKPSTPGEQPEPERASFEESAEGPGSRPPDDPRYASGYWAIGEDYYKGESSKAELETRLAEMNRNRSERRKKHVEGLLKIWGARVLSHPDAREELRIHARREAYSARMLFLAHTHPSVKERAKLVERLEGIIENESARYTRAMERLQPAPPAGAPSAPPSATRGGN